MLPSAEVRSPEEDTAASSEERVSVHFGILGRSPELSRRQWRVFGIAATAGFFDNYDRALLSLALKQIQRGLRIAEDSLGTVLSLIRLGYLLSLVITPIADVVGRRRLLLYTIFGYTIFTGLSAFAPGARSFAAFQFLARAFAGAEATVAFVVVSEEVDAGVRGWAIGLLSALGSVGYGIAALGFAGINVIPYGWRGLYALALIPLLLIIPLRRILPESRRFEREAESGLSPGNILVPLRALFRAYPARLGMLLAVAFLGSMGGNAAGILFPKYLQEAHGWSPGQVTELFFLAGAIGFLGNIVAGRLSDRFGRRMLGSLFYLLAPIMTVWMYSTHSNLVIPLWTVEVFFDTASSTIGSAFSAELFPTSYRATAGSALSVAGTTGGALGLFLEGILYRSTGSHWSAVRYLTVFWAIAPVIVYLFFPETAGRELEAISPEQPAG